MKHFLIISLLLFTACQKENRWDCTKSLGEETTEVRELNPFSEILSMDRVDITYRYAPDYRVEVIFGENIVEYVRTDVEGEILTISNVAKCNWVRDLSVKPEVVVYAPTLVHFENRGSGHVVFADTLRGEVFTYEQRESNGDVELLLDVADAAILMHTGYTKVTARGYCQNATLYSASVGKMFASGLLATNALVNNSSIQPMEIFAADYLYGAIYSRGDIRYLGAPAQIDREIDGSGEVRPL